MRDKPGPHDHQFFGIATGVVVFSVLLGSRNPLAPFGVTLFADTRLVTVCFSVVLAAVLGMYFQGMPRLLWWGAVGLFAVAWIVWQLLTRQLYDDSLTILVGTVFGLLGTYFSFNTSPDRLVIFVWVPVLVVVGLVFCFSIFQGPSGGGWFEGYGTGPIAYGRLMGTGAIISLALAAREARGSAAFVALAFPFCLGALLLSGSNGIQLALCVGLVTFLLGLRSARGLIRRALVATGMVVAATFLTFLASVWTKTSSLPGVESFAQGLQIRDSAIIPFYTAGRSSIWRATIQEFGSVQDLILGTGQVAISVQGNETHPHNLLLAIALAGGLFAVVGLCVLGALAGRSFFREAQARGPAMQIPGTLFLFWLSSSMLSGDFRDNQLVFLLLALMLGQAQRAKLQARLA